MTGAPPDGSSAAYREEGLLAATIAGLIAGLATVFVLSPFWSMVAGDAFGGFGGILGSMKKMIDIGAWGLLSNALVFAVVSWRGRRDLPPGQEPSVVHGVRSQVES